MIRTLIRYGATGVTGLTINVCLLVGLVDIAGIGEIPAAITSALVALGVSFFLTDRWVFEPGGARMLGPYLVVMLSAKGLNLGIYILLLDYVWYAVAWIVGSVLTFGTTFVVNRYLWSLPSGD